MLDYYSPLVCERRNQHGRLGERGFNRNLNKTTMDSLITFFQANPARVKQLDKK